MRAERDFNNRCEFDLAMRDIHQWSTRGSVRSPGRTAAAAAPIAFTQPLSPTCRASKSVLPDEIEVSYQVEPWAGATSSDTNVKRPAPISSARDIGGQQRSALSGVLALENGKNGRQDDQRGDGPPR